MLIKDICSSITDGSHNPPQGITSSSYLMLSSKNVLDDEITLDEPRFLSKEDFEKENKRTNVKCGDVLLTIVGTVGRVAVVSKNLPSFALQRSVAVLHPDESICSGRYLMYALRGKRSYIERHSKGIAQKGIYLKEVAGIDLLVTSKEIQEQIIEKLDKANSIIKCRQLELKKMDQLIKARFAEMFDLKKCTYGTFGNDTDFVDYRGKTPELSEVGTIRMVNAKSVGKGFFKSVDEYVTEETYDEWMHRGFGYPGDVLFVTEGHTFGNTCLVPDYLVKFALGQRVITIKGHRGVIENAFLCAYMQTDQFWKDINVYRTGGTAQGIRSKDLTKIRIPLPIIETQRQFADFTKQVDKSKVAVQKALDETQLLFDSLMQKYFG